MVAIDTILKNENNQIDKQSFYSYLNDNKPVVFTGLMKDWSALEKWTDNYLLETIGDHPVDVNMCTFGKMSDITKMSFSEYYKHSLSNDWNIDQSNNKNRSNKPYLRNFNMLEEFQVLGQDVKNEQLFNTDIHNLVIRGAFIGAKDSATRLHKDTGDNLVAVIRGKKFVVMVEPSQESKLVKPASPDLEVDINQSTESVDGLGQDVSNHPAFVSIDRVHTCVLEAGQALFIPIGWSHYIHNLEFTISISCWGKEMIN